MKINWLKVKAKIYQYTGVFLASKEREAYVNSDAYRDEFRRMIGYDDYGPKYTAEQCKDILVGAWEGHYGFHSYVSIKPWPFSRLEIMWKQFKSDVGIFND